MIKHVVCFKLKDASEENCKKAAEVLLSMKDNIDYIKEIEVGTDFLHSPRSFDVYLSVVLENEEMLDDLKLVAMEAIERCQRKQRKVSEGSCQGVRHCQQSASFECGGFLACGRQEYR